MNKNFVHRNIATLGGTQLVSFIDLLKENGWEGWDGWDGSAEECFYTIDEEGTLLFDVDKEDYTIVCATDFINYYKDMLAPMKESQEIISVTREEFKKIHDVACSGWQKKLSTWASLDVFKDKLEFTHNQIEEMIDASTETQLPIVLEVFHEYKYKEKELDLTKMEFNGEVFGEFGDYAMVSICIYDNKSFYLNKKYNWELINKENGETILIPTKK